MADMEHDVNVIETEAIFPEVETDIDVPVTVGEDDLTVLANSIDPNDVDIDADVDSDELVNVDITESTGGGTSDHRFLTHRDAANQHPISAIIGLTERLSSIESTFDTRLITAENGIVRLVMGQEQLTINVGQAQRDATTAAQMATSAGASAEIAQRAADAAIEANYKKYDTVTWSDTQILQRCAHGTTLTLPRHVVSQSDTEQYYLGDVKQGDIIVLNVLQSDHANKLAKLLVEATADAPQGTAVTGKVVSWNDNVMAHFWHDDLGSHVTSANGFRADLDGTAVKFFDNLGTQRASFGANGGIIGNPNGERFVQTATALQAYDSIGKYFEVTRNGLSYGNGTLVATAQSVVDAIGTAKAYTDVQITGPVNFINAVKASDTTIDGGAIETDSLSAISANMGTLTAGIITKGNSFMNFNNSPATFEFKNASTWAASTNGIKWDGTSFVIKGGVQSAINGLATGETYVSGGCLGANSITTDKLNVTGTLNVGTGLVIGTGDRDAWQSYVDIGYGPITMSSMYTSISGNRTLTLYGGTLLSISGPNQIDVSSSSITIAGSISHSGSLSVSGLSYFSSSIYPYKVKITDAGTSSSATPNCRLTDEGWVDYIKGGSSRLFKHDIKSVENDELNPNRLYDLDVIQFKYNEDYLNEDDDRQNKDLIGFIAEDLETIYPTAVAYTESGKVEGWNEKIIIPALLKLIQDQHRDIEELKARLNNLAA